MADKLYLVEPAESEVVCRLHKEVGIYDWDEEYYFRAGEVDDTASGGWQEGAPFDARVIVHFFDAGTETITITYYDNTDTEHTETIVTKTNTNEWVKAPKTLTYPLKTAHDHYAEQNHGDFFIASTGLLFLSEVTLKDTSKRTSVIYRPNLPNTTQYNFKTQSDNYVPNVSGYMIDENTGNAEFNYLLARQGGNIGGWTIEPNQLSSDSGNAILNAAVPFRSLGNLTSFSDATAGHAGVWEGKDTGIYKKVIGSRNLNQYMSWDGAQLYVSGTIAGTIVAGGTDSNSWTINQDLTDANVDLIFGRTTGGNATIRWNGSVVNVLNTLQENGVTVVKENRQVIAGAGLTGGGALSANVTLTVSAGAGITVNADDVALTTPGTLTVATSNNAAGNHTHAVTSSSNPGAAAALLATDSFGGITLQALTVNGNLNVTGDGDILVGNEIKLLDHGSHGHITVNTALVDEQFDIDAGGNIRAQGYFVGKHALQVPNALMILHFDGAEPYETNYTGETTGHMGQIGTLSGGVIFRPGKFGKGLQIAEATTNLITNPSVETNLTGWATRGTPPTLERSSADAYVGGYSVHVVADSVTDGTRPSCGVSASTTYTISAYYKILSGTWKVAVSDTVGILLGDTDLGAADSTWKRISRTVTTNVAATTLFIFFESTNAGGGEIYIDGLQVEQKAYVTPYCDGALGTGHSWSGTAHASTSSRTAARLQYPVAGNLDLQRGTFACWYYLEAAGNVSFPALFDARADANNLLVLHWGQSSGTYKVYADAISGGTTVSTAIGAATQAAGWHHVALTWESGALTVYVDGAQSGVIGSYVPPIGTVTNFDIGSRASGSAQANTVIDDVVILDRVASAAEIRAIYESNAPVFAETSNWHWRSANTLVWADSEGLWAQDTSGNAAFGVSGINGKSWGGLTLDAGDVLLGRSGAYAWWDASAISLTIGDVGASKSNLLLSAGSVKVRSNTTVLGEWDTSGNLKLGTNTTSPSTTNIFISNASQTYNGEAGFVAGDILIGDNSSGKFNTKISAGALAMRVGTTPYFQIATSGNVTLGNVATNQGNAHWNNTNKRLEFRGGASGTVVQAYIDTDGSFRAGGGNHVLDANGLSIAIGGSVAVTNKVRFVYSGNETGYVSGYTTVGTTDTLEFKTLDHTARDLDKYLLLAALANTTKNATLLLTAGYSETTGSPVQVQLARTSDDDGNIYLKNAGVEFPALGYAPSAGTKNDVSTKGTSHLEANPAGNITITGFANGQDGKILFFVNKSSNNVTFNHQDAGSSAANRIAVGNATNRTLTGEGYALFFYSASRWRLLAIES